MAKTVLSGSFKKADSWQRTWYAFWSCSLTKQSSVSQSLYCLPHFNDRFTWWCQACHPIWVWSASKMARDSLPGAHILTSIRPRHCLTGAHPTVSYLFQTPIRANDCTHILRNICHTNLWRQLFLALCYLTEIYFKSGFSFQKCSSLL